MYGKFVVCVALEGNGSYPEYELYGKSDLRFIEGLFPAVVGLRCSLKLSSGTYKVCRDVFSYRPSLSRDQFFSPGFAERKILFVCDLITECKKKHNELQQKAGVRRRGSQRRRNSQNRRFAAKFPRTRRMDSNGVADKAMTQHRMTAAQNGVFVCSKLFLDVSRSANVVAKNEPPSPLRALAPPTATNQHQASTYATATQQYKLTDPQTLQSPPHLPMSAEAQNKDSISAGGYQR